MAKCTGSKRKYRLPNDGSARAGFAGFAGFFNRLMTANGQKKRHMKTAFCSFFSVANGSTNQKCQPTSFTTNLPEIQRQ